MFKVTNKQPIKNSLVFPGFTWQKSAKVHDFYSCLKPFYCDSTSMNQLSLENHQRFKKSGVLNIVNLTVQEKIYVLRNVSIHHFQKKYYKLRYDLHLFPISPLIIYSRIHWQLYKSCYLKVTSGIFLHFTLNELQKLTKTLFTSSHVSFCPQDM